jgi:putative peptidoglycan lipid II flippase
VAAYALGLPAIAAYYVVTRAYYALQDMATPVRIGAGMIVLNAGLDYVLMRAWGAPGIALATSIVSTANVLILLSLLRRRLDGIDAPRIGTTALRAGVAALGAGAVAAGALQFVAPLVATTGASGQLAQLAVAAVAGGAAYLLLCRLFRVGELQVAWAMLTRRGRPAADTAR